MGRPKKRDYECSQCGSILTDKELDQNDGICNECLLHGDDLYEKEDNYWEEYK